MPANQSLLTFLAYRNPRIWELINPRGAERGIIIEGGLEERGIIIQGGRGARVSGTSPIPWADAGFELGAAAGVELIRTARLAEALGSTFRPNPDEICPPRRPWPFPFPFPPRVKEDFFDDDENLAGYALGLATVLEASLPSWAETSAAEAMHAVYDTALNQVGGR
jgi:hypothetical protein